MMRKVSVLLVMLMLPLLSWAQTKVNASEIIAKINRGEAVSYKNAEIVGDLDMTKLKNMKLVKGGDSKYNSKEYASTVTAPLTFVNCTFTGDVLAYFNPENDINLKGNNSEVYNTNFEKDVLFENCTFKEKAAFKYSEFEGIASFMSSRFAEEALFKYADFEKSVNFSNARFGGEANFKYVEFPERASFAGANFTREANFKYAKFERGANFEKALFDGTANFKYTKVSDSFNIKGANFRGDNDFKYTELNNRKVTLSSLQSMNK
ncbi:pentapeptide repeat-containing protein [Pontibacter anaerobius]|uniref:Pentapeptide repeat-containing protein n=1 Tax=Pontibacter anaerobius TaxID=2993940 RepID=A0ABT3RA97_9BACT|nr:pentapeptide repeat-containing protein [Pontibacter anaerobius]MCX2738324.1 pentapeptide repeat-containing protein [Pontibacter anaerobius]